MRQGRKYMAHGRDFRSAIDRIVADLTRIAERAIAAEVERAIALAIDPIERSAKSSVNARNTRRARESTAAAAERAEQRAEQRREAREAAEQAREARQQARDEQQQVREEQLQAREAERLAREAERTRRKEEREKLREELRAAREAAREAARVARAAERAKQQGEKVGARAERGGGLISPKVEPPPLVVFKRSRDGQVTVLQPRPVDPETGKEIANGSAASSNTTAANSAVPLAATPAN